MRDDLAIIHRGKPIEPARFVHIRRCDNHAHEWAMRADRIDQLPELPPRERIDAGGGRGGSVCLNRFSGLISGVPAVVTKMMDPRSGTA